VICPSGSFLDPKGFFRHSAACATGIWTIFRQGRSDSGLRREYRAFTNLYFYNLPYGKYGGSTSALERLADSSRTSPHFRFVPTVDIRRDHSIISSARTSNEGGMVRPSALAVFMLIASSNLVGCSTGTSEGLAPLRILST
jgi:hypothetical protein